MKRCLAVFLFLGGILQAAKVAQGAPLLVNDGTTTTNLFRFANSLGTTSINNPDATPATTTVTSSNGVLVAAQSPLVTELFLRSSWLARAYAPTGAVYTVAADFRPEVVEFRRRGGVAGEVNLVSRRGVVFYLSSSPDDPELSFLRTALVDFAAGAEPDNESLTNLFNLDGSPATDDVSSARSGTEGHDPTTAATLELQFAAPSPADLAVLSNATAHITAKAFQTTAGASNQIGRTIELLTDLSLPEGSAHRFGYFGYWASTLLQGDVIGQFDNLVFDGGFVVPTNLPPTVSLILPTNGATFSSPAEVLLTADPFDPEGAVARVDFFAGPTLVGTSTNNPFSIMWTNSTAGTYSLTARATDEAGAVGNSTNAVSITISAAPAPLVQVTSPPDGTGFLAPAEIIVEADAVPSPESPLSSIVKVDFFANTNLIGSSPNGPNGPYSITWLAVPAGTYSLVARATDDLGGVGTSTNQVVITVTNAAPAGDAILSIASAGTGVVVTWPAEFTGIPLQSKTNLSALQWVDVSGSTLTNSVTIPVSGGASFFRLSNAGATLAPAGSSARSGRGLESVSRSRRPNRGSQ